jgi:hypothetical protein
MFSNELAIFIPKRYVFFLAFSLLIIKIFILIDLYGIFLTNNYWQRVAAVKITAIALDSSRAVGFINLL